MAETIDQVERHIYVSDNSGLKYGFTQIKVSDISGSKRIYSSAGVGGNEASREINQNEWYMITVAVDQDSVKHYLNGKLIGSFVKGNVKSNNGSLFALLGASRVNDRYFDGKMDDLRIYNKSLSQTEITTLYIEGQTAANPKSYLELSKVNIYPNPTSGILYVKSDKMYIGYEVEVLNSLGQVLYKSTIDHNDYKINTSDWASKGVHMVQIYGEDNRLIEVMKILVE